ncbi:MAG TPA: 1-deoxy-D-xylulose-5-phosphate synthase [Candidatus Limnocylindria bacterium]|nr:1-deoxy-D-xylulose-5-phosphate synthase [Candidatus Limnocylindria bacterium]
MPILPTLTDPAALRGMDEAQLAELAAELREKMIRTVHETGGHLASSLGAVEITLALHRVMDSPRDRIVWDTGHQAYAHKLLTGRYEQFGTLRQVGGVGGFPRRSESVHDVMDGGHAGTGVSIGVGLAAARDLAPRTSPARDQRIAVCVGDAALQSGLTLEALNHVGHIRTRLLIVLNDNEMSISPSVGGLSTRLNKLRLSRAYQETKEASKRALPRIPIIGQAAFDALAWAKEGFKRSWAKVGFFEDMGITYIGVLDGHDRAELEDAFDKAFALPNPVLVHVKTVKGKGYAPAEEDSVSFHGASLPPVDLTLIDPTEDAIPPAHAPRKPKTYTQTFSEELVRLAEHDDRICAITAGMPTGTGLARFEEHFPGRLFDVGIAEQHAMTMAAGLALAGKRPVVALYSTFSQRAYDQLVHDVCQNDAAVLVAIDRAGLVGEDGTSHQGMFTLSAQRSLPNLVIGSPKDEQELRDLVVTAFAHDGPISLHYPRDAGEDLPDRTGEPLEIGRGEVLRTGDDLLLVGFGPIVQRLRRVAETLAAEDGVEATVVNARWAKPLDETLIAEHAAGKRLVVTAEESAAMGGFGDAVLDALNRAGIHAPLHKVALAEGFVHHGAVDDLRRQQRIDEPGILAQVREALGGVPAQARAGSRVTAASG